MAKIKKLMAQKMTMKKISIDKNTLTIIYKLLHDALFLALLTFAGALVADGLLPGLVTNKVSYSKIIVVILLLIGLITYLGKNLDITYSAKKINKIKILPVLVLLAFLLIGNSMLLFALWENILITLITLFVFYLFYELLLERSE